MAIPKVHVLYEHAWDMVPFGTSQIRLLRPLSHPSLSKTITMSAGPEYYGRQVDIIIVDRLWRPDISLNLANSLMNDIKRIGAKFVYALDDNFLAFPIMRDGWFTQDKLDVVKYFLEKADAVWVTTENLRNAVKGNCKKVVVIPNCIDERLIRENSNAKSRKNKLTIGYMGTYTHNQDLEIVMPVIIEILNDRPDINFEILGITDKVSIESQINNLKHILTPPDKVEYTKFLPWFTSTFSWDIAIAPLQDNIINKCKSDIKFLDYSSIGAAGIYSYLDPYIMSTSVTNYETGCIVHNIQSEWRSAIELLLWNSKFREKIVEKSRGELLSNRIILKRYRDWENSILEILG